MAVDLIIFEEFYMAFILKTQEQINCWKFLEILQKQFPDTTLNSFQWHIFPVIHALVKLAWCRRRWIFILLCLSVYHKTRDTLYILTFYPQARHLDPKCLGLAGSNNILLVIFVSWFLTFSAAPFSSGQLDFLTQLLND